MSELEHRHLRSAIEFAVLMAAEGQKRKHAFPFPKELRPFFNKPRIPTGSLGRLRRVIENDPAFRQRIAVGALPDLVDEIGRLWLVRPAGWETKAVELAAAADEASQADDLATQLKRAEKRREAAEQAAVRAQVELLRLNEIVAAQGTELHELRADLAKADEAVQEMRTELVDVRMEVRHARDRESAAVARASQADDALAVAQATSARRSEDVSPEPADDDSATEAASAARIEHRVEIATAADAARALADRLDSLIADDSSPGSRARSDATAGQPRRRVQIGLPGGVIATSGEAAAFLVRSDAAVLIDGYNVAKLGWPNRPLIDQRRNLLDAVENLARRHGTDITVVFDGAAVVGAHADRRRLARVVYSAEGVTADDVIRDEVRRLPPARAVVVVTNDAEIVRDVRAAGANVLPSNALLAVT